MHGSKILVAQMFHERVRSMKLEEIPPLLTADEKTEWLNLCLTMNRALAGTDAYKMLPVHIYAGGDTLES